MSATAQTTDSPTSEKIAATTEFPHAGDQAAAETLPARLEHHFEDTADAEPRATRLSEQPRAVLLGHITRLEASMGAALSLLRRCIVERETPTREALAAEAGFAMGMPREAALRELDELAQLVGVSSLR